MTTSADLTQINTAISAIENGAQEYKIKDRFVRRPDLALLYQERRLLEQKLDSENSSGIGYSTYVAAFSGR